MRLFVGLVFALFLTIPGSSSRVPKDIEKTVVFIYKTADGAPEQADGTGFVIGITVPNHPDQIWPYLITAQHVLHVDGQNLNSPFRNSIFMRCNRRNGEASMVSLPLSESGPMKNVFLEADTSVDVAVIRFRFPDDQFDVMNFAEDMLVTEQDLKDYNIGVGTDVFFTGMFAPYQGQKRNYPIVRFGRLAMVPEEKIPFGGRLEDAYLMETFSFGGNSGSPVFFYPSGDNTPGTLRLGSAPLLKIAGVMQGFYGDIEPIAFAQPTYQQRPPIPVSQSNSGIAVVIPAQHIRNILRSQELEQARQEDLKLIEKQSGH